MGADTFDRDSARVVPAGSRTRIPKVAELIASQLRRQIVRGQLRAGDALPPESALLKQFDVSRPTLREAFRLLESESLIAVRRGSNGGARVQTPDAEVAARHAATVLQYRQTTLEDVYEARVIMEPPCLGLLAELRTDDTLARLRVALAERDAATDAVSLGRSHLAFHSLLIELTGNQTLRLLWSMLETIFDRANVTRIEDGLMSPSYERAARKGLAAHHRVVDLIEARDAAAAESLWRKHLSEARDYLVRRDVRTVLDLLE